MKRKDSKKRKGKIVFKYTSYNFDHCDTGIPTDVKIIKSTTPELHKLEIHYRYNKGIWRRMPVDFFDNDMLYGELQEKMFGGDVFGIAKETTPTIP